MGELSSWSGKYIRGEATYQSIAEQLLKTAEGQARFASGLNNADFIKTLYQLTFGTTPDADSQALLTTRLDEGESRGQIVFDVMTAMSGEAKSRLDHAVHIGMNPAPLSSVAHQVVVQDNHMAYDRFNRMTRVMDGRYDVAFAYDNVSIQPAHLSSAP